MLDSHNDVIVFSPVLENLLKVCDLLKSHRKMVLVCIIAAL